MLQKANTNTLRIAGLLHYFSDQETEIIPLNVVQRASLIMDWYLNQAVSWFYQFTDEYKFYQDVEEPASGFIINLLPMAGSHSKRMTSSSMDPINSAAATNLNL